MDGMRKCLHEEFSSLYIFNLKGDIRKNMLSKGKAGEGQNIFGSGSMTGICISILVKNPKIKSNSIYYYGIKNNLTKDEKLKKIHEYESILNIKNLEKIYPNQFYDWINQRDINFDQYISIGNKKLKKENSIFQDYSMGVASNRDSWVYNYSLLNLCLNIKNMIAFYNKEVTRFKYENPHKINVQDFISRDSTQISWSSSLIPKVENGIYTDFNKNKISISLYRPFIKQLIYFDSMIIHRISKMPKVFPTNNHYNIILMTCGVGSRNGFSCFISNIISDANLLEAGSQCFPLYLYEKVEQTSGEIFGENYEIIDGYQRRDAITDDALAHFQEQYQGENINKEDIFYYIYGLLHSEEYREKYADNLSKQLPRIPKVKNSADFWAFSQVGRDLADLHLNYESIPMYDGVLFKGGLKIVNDTLTGGIGEDFYVEKMKFAKKDDKSKVVYNKHFTIENIPLEAYEYIVNGKPALEWVMERQSVKTDKASGIVNDANDWAIETMNNPRYPMELFLRVITVSLETMKIVNQLPKLAI